ncbi:MAG: 2,3,4,5-tetrahydropyridine-2,6-dicarboxylate N-succinyltransferase [Actinomycetota bacterium]|nr:2,3,4,5-tetrahydropyridine-2,6-dicarboxylate N-succinyltransferase [Actinomycetota bacterium]
MEVRDAVAQTMALLDRGQLRVADPPTDEDGEWTVNSWVREAILLYFRQAEMMRMEAGPFQYHDKIPVKTGHADNGVRVVPPGTARYGSFLEAGVVMMPSYVNIGAWVGSGTMVDTWATVGSCAQIGRDVHLSGGVGIGGVLEPPGADPVIVEDGAFIGSRCVVVEGARIGREAVLGALTVITASTPIIDVRGDEPSTARGVVPPRAVVVPGTRPRDFPAGTYHLPCALIIGERTASTDRKTSLNQALREFQVQT